MNRYYYIIEKLYEQSLNEKRWWESNLIKNLIKIGVFISLFFYATSTISNFPNAKDDNTQIISYWLLLIFTVIGVILKIIRDSKNSNIRYSENWQNEINRFDHLLKVNGYNAERIKELLYFITETKNAQTSQKSQRYNIFLSIIIVLIGPFIGNVAEILKNISRGHKIEGIKLAIIIIAIVLVCFVLFAMIYYFIIKEPTKEEQISWALQEVLLKRRGLQFTALKNLENISDQIIIQKE